MKRDLNLSGNISISIIMADTYALAKLNTSDGMLKRVPPLPQYNGVQAFIPNLTLAKVYSTPPIDHPVFINSVFNWNNFFTYSPRKLFEST